MRNRCLSTPPAWAVPSPKKAEQTEVVGWDVAGSAAVKLESIPTGGARISTGKESDSKTAKGSPSPTPAEPPVALYSLAEIVDKPIEWVVEGVIPRGELTLITGEAGVGKSGFLAGLIANVTRGRPGPRDPVGPEDAVCPRDSEHSGDRGRSEGGSDTDSKTDTDPLLKPCRISADGPGAPLGSDVARDKVVGHSVVGHSVVGHSVVGHSVGAINAEKRHSSSATNHTPAAVVIFSTANILADAVRPRLIEAGADLGKVYALCQLEEEPFDGTSRPAGGRDVGTGDATAVQTDGAGGRERDNPEGGHGTNVGSGGAGEIAAGADSVAESPSLRPRMFQWHRDLPVLEAELARLRANGVAVSMMVIDAVDGYVAAPRRRSLSAAEVEKLAELARKFRVAIVLAANVSPAAMLRANRPRGMAGIDALSTVARTVWMIVRDPNVASGRMLVPIKKNCSMHENGFAYVLSQGKIAWAAAPVGIPVEDLLNEVIMTPQDRLAREQKFASDRAANWLQERLGNGKVAAFEVQAEAAEHEITAASLRRAFQSLGCKTLKEQNQGEKVRWYWRLPDEGLTSRCEEPRFLAQPVPATQAGLSIAGAPA